MILMKASVIIRLLCFYLLFHMKYFAYFLGRANLRNNSLLVRTISILICRSDKWRIHFLVKLHGKPFPTACLNKIKVLIGKHFFCHFKNNLGTHLTHFQPFVAFDVETSNLFCSANQVTGFYMECNTGLKWVKGTLIPMWKLG